MCRTEKTWKWALFRHMGLELRMTGLGAGAVPAEASPCLWRVRLWAVCSGLQGSADGFFFYYHFDSPNSVSVVWKINIEKTPLCRLLGQHKLGSMQAVGEKKTQWGEAEEGKGRVWERGKICSKYHYRKLKECFLKHTKQIEHLCAVVCAYVPIWACVLSSRPPWTL